MGHFTFFDHLFNVCRSFSDVMHICAYLLLVIIATLVAFYKFDAKLYNKHVYFPLIKFLVKKQYLEIVSFSNRGRRFSKKFLVLRWTANSNRLPYFVKAIKNFFNKFN